MNAALQMLQRTEESAGRKGYAAELLVAADLHAKGFNVSFAAPGCVYDLIAERENWFIRIQVKLAQPNNKYWRFHTKKRAGKRDYQPYNAEDFDCFAVVVTEDNNLDIFYPPNEGGSMSRQVNDEVKTFANPPYPNIATRFGTVGSLSDDTAKALVP